MSHEPRREPDTEPGLSGARMGIVALLYANDDLPELTPAIDADVLLDELVRLGFGGLQLSRVLPTGRALNQALESRGLRIAEVYAAMPCSIDGPPPEARDLGRQCIQQLVDADGDVLVLS